MVAAANQTRPPLTWNEVALSPAVLAMSWAKGDRSLRMLYARPTPEEKLVAMVTDSPRAKYPGEHLTCYCVESSPPERACRSALDDEVRELLAALGWRQASECQRSAIEPLARHFVRTD